MSVTLLEGTIGNFSWGSIPTNMPYYPEKWKDEEVHGGPVSVFHNSSRAHSSVHSLVVMAAMMLADTLVCCGYRPGSGVLKVTDSIYAVEYTHADDHKTFAAFDSDTGSIRAIDCTLSPDGSEILTSQPFPTMRKGAGVNGLPIMMALIAGRENVDAEVKLCMDNIRQLLPKVNTDDTAYRGVTDAMFILSDNIYFGLKDGKFPFSLAKSGDITKMDVNALSSGAYSGELVVGMPEYLTIAASNASSNTVARHTSITVGELKKDADIAAYAAAHQGVMTEESKKLIPDYPDDFPVPPEVVTMITSIVKSADKTRPIVQMGWRGTSGFGKSTGVEILCSILQKPLLKFTCSSTTEKQDFLTQIVPDTSAKTAPAQANVTFAEISYDPESAWQKLTGENRDGVTCEEAFAEALRRMSASNSSTPRYVMQESAYIQALKNGWVCEVQESSRIRDPGVLPGLNEYDRPGALIPQVDGTYSRRHNDAIVIYTDNVGYRSCNELDPAVVRRIAFFIDSVKLPKDALIKRIKRNQKDAFDSGAISAEVLNIMYATWNKVYEYCADQDLLTAGGSVTSEELERWVELTGIMGVGSIVDTCRMCVVNKATADYEEQEKIMSAIVKDELASISAV